MSILSLEAEKNNEIKHFVNLCKSESGIHGFMLRDAHYKLGNILAKRMFNDFSDKTDISVIVMMRAGLCFGLGIADKLEQLGINVSVIFHYENCLPISTNKVIIVDAVINTGENIINFADKLISKNIIFATNVISEKAVHKFKNKILYTVRISEKNFKGAKVSAIKNGKGPDTGDRLFNTIESFLESC
ncbi:MAG: uracil phosphoribosyltransferase [Spirochaetes bacterium]|nr:uracil phosphoribosyltransferase [Spirochaetota bacterium]